MLAVGFGDMADEEYQAHLSLWAALHSPLSIGHAIPSMLAFALTIIYNPVIHALSQDPRGRSVTRVRRDVQAVPLNEGALPSRRRGALVFLNTSSDNGDMSRSLAEIFAAFSPGVGLRNENPQCVGEKIGVAEAGIIPRATVNSHATKLFQLRRIEKDGEGLKGNSVDRGGRG
ncbi:uncharacterized protein PG986_011676 [Apiospora aurea]|uniref:alpha-galactosidase n=1 Tax=Apiospora aurea TaxID=335848 RepID=A0ABR1PXW6_9PEZI